MLFSSRFKILAPFKYNAASYPEFQTLSLKYLRKYVQETPASNAHFQPILVFGNGGQTADNKATASSSNADFAPKGIKPTVFELIDKLVGSLEALPEVTELEKQLGKTQPSHQAQMPKAVMHELASKIAVLPNAEKQEESSDTELSQTPEAPTTPKEISKLKEIRLMIQTKNRSEQYINEIENLKNRFKTLFDKIEEETSLVRFLNTHIETLLDYKESLKFYLNQIPDVAKDLRELLEKQTNELNSQKHRLIQHIRTFTDNQIAIGYMEDSDNTYKGLQTQINSLNERHPKLTEDIQRAKDELNKKQAELAWLQEEYAQIETSKTAESTLLSEKLKEKEEEVKALQEKYSQEISKREEEIAALTEEYAQQEKLLDELRQKNTEIETDLVRLREQCSETALAFKSALDEKQQLSAKFEGLKTQAEQARAQAGEAKIQAEEANAKLSALKDQLQSLQLQNKTTENTIGKYEKEKVEAEAKSKELLEKLAVTVAEADNAKKRLKELKREVKAKDQRIESLGAELVNLTRAYEEQSMMLNEKSLLLEEQSLIIGRQQTQLSRLEQSRNQSLHSSSTNISLIQPEGPINQGFVVGSSPAFFQNKENHRGHTKEEQYDPEKAILPLDEAGERLVATVRRNAIRAIRRMLATYTQLSSQEPETAELYHRLLERLFENYYGDMVGTLAEFKEEFFAREEREQKNFDFFTASIKNPKSEDASASAQRETLDTLKRRLDKFIKANPLSKIAVKP